MGEILSSGYAADRVCPRLALVIWGVQSRYHELNAQLMRASMLLLMMATKFQAKHKHRLVLQLDLVGHLMAVLRWQIPNLEEY